MHFMCANGIAVRSSSLSSCLDSEGSSLLRSDLPKDVHFELCRAERPTRDGARTGRREKLRAGLPRPRYTRQQLPPGAQGLGLVCGVGATVFPSVGPFTCFKSESFKS